MQENNETTGATAQGTGQAPPDSEGGGAPLGAPGSGSVLEAKVDGELVIPGEGWSALSAAVGGTSPAFAVQGAAGLGVVAERVTPAPTVGRRVWYWSDDADIGNIISRNQPFDAGIVYVHGNGRVNLAVTDHRGNVFPRTDVRLVTPGDVEPLHGHGVAQWMPVQVTPAYNQRGAA